MRSLVLTFAILLPIVSKADCKQGDLKNKNNVIVFGGVGSTTQAMEGCYPNFVTFGLDDSSKNFQCLKHEIESSQTTADRPIIIAGHSSGAANAQRLVQLLGASGKSKVRLVLLEGFGIQQNQGVPTTCWSAQNGSTKGMNYGAMQTLKACNVQKYYDDKRKPQEGIPCTNALCLHISLVNRSVPHTVVDKMSALRTGLSNCVGNTAWLENDQDKPFNSLKNSSANRWASPGQRADR